MKIAVARIGAVVREVVDEAQRSVETLFGCEASLRASLPVPRDSTDERRKQHSSVAFMLALAGAGVADADHILGVTECDLFIPMLTFVFGQAQLGGRVALVSVARLRQEFYGAAPDDELLRQRLRKEVGHEIGHSLGLIHCPDRRCLMCLATSIQDVDRKSAEFCGSCRAAVNATGNGRRL